MEAALGGGDSGFGAFTAAPHLLPIVRPSLSKLGAGLGPPMPQLWRQGPQPPQAAPNAGKTIESVLRSLPGGPGAATWPPGGTPVSPSLVCKPPGQLRDVEILGAARETLGLESAAALDAASTASTPEGSRSAATPRAPAVEPPRGPRRPRHRPASEGRAAQPPAHGGCAPERKGAPSAEAAADDVAASASKTRHGRRVASNPAPASAREPRRAAAGGGVPPPLSAREGRAGGNRGYGQDDDAQRPPRPAARMSSPRVAAGAAASSSTPVVSPRRGRPSSTPPLPPVPCSAGSSAAAARCRSASLSSGNETPPQSAQASTEREAASACAPPAQQSPRPQHMSVKAQAAAEVQAMIAAMEQEVADAEAAQEAAKGEVASSAETRATASSSSSSAPAKRSSRVTGSPAGISIGVSASSSSTAPVHKSSSKTRIVASGSACTVAPAASCPGRPMSGPIPSSAGNTQANDASNADSPAAQRPSPVLEEMERERAMWEAKTAGLLESASASSSARTSALERCPTSQASSNTHCQPLESFQAAIGGGSSSSSWVSGAAWTLVGVAEAAVGRQHVGVEDLSPADDETDDEAPGGRIAAALRAAGFTPGAEVGSQLQLVRSGDDSGADNAEDVPVSEVPQTPSSESRWVVSSQRWAAARLRRKWEKNLSRGGTPCVAGGDSSLRSTPRQQSSCVLLDVEAASQCAADAGVAEDPED